MHRHDREQLFHGPTVGHALEQREITEVSIREQCIEAFQLFREEIEFGSVLMYLAADCPIEVLGQASLLKRQVSKAEQIQRRIKRLLGVVVSLEEILLGDGSVCLKQVDERLFGIFRQRRRKLRLAESADSKNVEHEHAVVSRNRSSALRDDVRVRHFRFIADTLDVVDDVARIFLERVVNAGFEVGLRAVVIDSQAAANIQIA